MIDADPCQPAGAPPNVFKARSNLGSSEPTAEFSRETQVEKELPLRIDFGPVDHFLDSG